MIDVEENLKALQRLVGNVSWIHYRESLGVHKGVDLLYRADGQLKGLHICLVDMSPRYRAQTPHGRRIASMDWNRWQFYPMERGKVLGAVAYAELRTEAQLLTSEERAEWDALCEAERNREIEEKEARDQRQRKNELRELERLQDKYANRQVIKLVATLQEPPFQGQSLLFEIVSTSPTCKTGRCRPRGCNTTIGQVLRVSESGAHVAVRVMGEECIFNIVDNRIEGEIEVVKGDVHDKSR